MLQVADKKVSEGRNLAAKAKKITDKAELFETDKQTIIAFERQLYSAIIDMGSLKESLMITQNSLKKKSFDFPALE